MTGIDSFLNSRLDQYVNEISRLCAQPSVSARSEGTHECADLVAQVLGQHGFAVQKFETPGNPVLVAHADGESPRTLLCYNHYDVQPPEPLELWTTPPYQPTLRDGALYARGAKDDKGELVARLAAVDAVRSAHGGKLPCGITFVVEGEEEIGSPHIAAFVKQHLALLKCEGAIWEEGETDPDGRPQGILGARGILYVELEAQTLKMDAHSGDAHILPNAAWRLLRALTVLKDEAEHILIPGFYDNVKRPTDRDRALIAALPDREKYLREHFLTGDFVLGYSGKALELAVFEPTCNIAGISAGYQGAGSKTVIPAKATAKLDFRLVPDQDPQDILAKLRAHLRQTGFEDIKVTPIAGMMWPFKEEPDNPLVALCSRTAEEVYGKPSVMVPMVGGSSPIYAFARPLGNIPVIMPGLGYGENRTHSPNEHIRLGDLVNAARHIARIIDGYAELK
ncbi:MAG TPA: M20/M25/M40 family metallo-hydrolase [Aggregatilineales bacterium]|nr:M20/M25/M40 family metallo-hydrolase [Aggregatilineales bacterium]